MTEYFGHVRGGLTTYVGGDGNSITECRRLLMYHGEDVAKVVEQFWREHSGDFVIVPETDMASHPALSFAKPRSSTEDCEHGA